MPNLRWEELQASTESLERNGPWPSLYCPESDLPPVRGLRRTSFRPRLPEAATPLGVGPAWKALVSPLLGIYDSNTILSPSSTALSNFGGSLPMYSIRDQRLRVKNWDTLTTESLSNPLESNGTKTLPGASANFKLLEKIATTAVPRELRLNRAA